MQCLLIPCKDRKARQKFSEAYKIFYKENSLCYLTEILHAAQESYSYIIVNSEKYIFSPNVLRTGNKLYNSFENLRYLIKDICNLYYNDKYRMYEDHVNEYIIDTKKIINELTKCLETFEKYCTVFEKVVLIYA